MVRNRAKVSAEVETAKCVARTVKAIPTEMRMDTKIQRLEARTHPVVSILGGGYDDVTDDVLVAQNILPRDPDVRERYEFLDVRFDAFGVERNVLVDGLDSPIQHFAYHEVLGIWSADRTRTIARRELECDAHGAQRRQ